MDTDRVFSLPYGPQCFKVYPGVKMAFSPKKSFWLASICAVTLLVTFYQCLRSDSDVCDVHSQRCFVSIGSVLGAGEHMI